MRHVIESYRIFEATSPSEWNDLTDAKKEIYALIISQARVNMADDSIAKTALWNLFAEGSDTRADLEVLLRPPEEEPEE